MKHFFLLFVVILVACGRQVEGIPPAPPAPPVMPPTLVAPTATVAASLGEALAEATSAAGAAGADGRAAVAGCAAVDRDEICQAGNIRSVPWVNQIAWGEKAGDKPLLKLSADLAENEGALTLLSLGAGRIVELTKLLPDQPQAVVAGEDAPGKEAPGDDPPQPAPQQITFFSEAGTTAAPSGLLIVTPARGRHVALGLNGTQVRLPGSLWAEAAAGGSLTLTVLSGDATAFSTGGVAAAQAGDRIVVQISPDGLATSEPVAVTGVNALDAVPLLDLVQVIQADGPPG